MAGVRIRRRGLRAGGFAWSSPSPAAVIRNRPRPIAAIRFCNYVKETEMISRTAPGAQTRVIAAPRHQSHGASAPALALLAVLGHAPFAYAAPPTPFQEYVNGSCNASFSYCDIAFSRPPLGKRLEISDVSCYARANSGDRLTNMYVTINDHQNSFLHAVFLAPEQIAEAGGTAVFAANHSLLAYADAGERIYATVLGTGAFQQFACHLGGMLIDR
jgi:hypothetical protein